MTPDLIGQILSNVSLSWLNIVMIPLHYTVLNTDRLCSQPPPVLPLIDQEAINASPGELQRYLDAVAWPYFCECTPGAPDPIDFPPPVAVQPPSWPAPITFPCDPADLCYTISQIWREVAALRSTTSSMYALVTDMQRYSEPFGVIPGALHFGLTGEGSFAVPRLVGLHVRITSAPPGLVLDSNPDYWWNQGWMSIVNDTGLLDTKRIARQDHMWLPPAAQLATRFAWHLKDGVTIDVRELYAEP